MNLQTAWVAVETTLGTLPAWLAVVLALGVSLAAARLIQVGGDVLIARLTSHIEGRVDDVVLRTVHPALYVTVVVAGVYLAATRIVTDVTLTEPLRDGVVTALVVLWAVTLVRLGGRVSRELTANERFDHAVVPIFQNVWSIVILTAAVFLSLAVWDVDVTPLLASAGVLGIVLGFAAKDTIANFFGSIALYFDGTYAVGDYVVLDSGERGRVEDVSIRSTVLRTRDDVLVTVPNSVLNAARITNESTPERNRRIRIPVGVAYGTAYDHVESVLLSVAEDERLVADSPVPRVRFRGFGDSALDLELLCWIPNPVLRGRAVHRLNREVYRRFTDEGIEIPFPQRVVTVADDAGPGAVATPADPEAASGDGSEPLRG